MSAQTPPFGAGPGDRVGPDGRYELVDRVGSGGMGSVYRARDHKLGCDRAVKVLEARYAAIPAFVERFRREAMAASRITHPNIVSVLDVAGEDERPVFLVMELLEGKTLSQMVKGTGRMPWAQVQRYIDQIAAGLGAAHAQGVVHRDVKPGNCLVLPDDQVKVLDFGIAKVTDMPAEVVALTAAGEIIGTCSYMAPEQIRGQVDKRSDIYALGVLTFRLLTGRVPFSHRQQDKVLLAHLTEPPPVPSSLVSGLPQGVDDFVLRMLAKQPHKRFDGMEELRRLLSGIERGVAVAFDAPTAVPPGSRTEMFEDARTQALIREPTPSGESEPAHVGLNTAPAGSGTLALEAGGAPLPGTVVLESSPRPPLGGGTVVVHGPSAGAMPAGAGVPAGPVAAALGGVTVPSAPPRALGNLGVVDGAPPRVTRFAEPVESSDGSVIRGVVAAIGGIGLAAAVVSGWVLWKRNAVVEAPAVAPALVVEGEADEAAASVEAPLPTDDVDGAFELPADGGAARVEPAEAPTEPSKVEAAQPEAVQPEAVQPVPPVVEVKGKTRRNPNRTKGSETKTGDSKAAEAEPEEAKPEPEVAKATKKKRKSGDLRDPF